MNCHDDVGLEKLLLNAAPAEASAHVQHCPTCIAKLEVMKKEDQAFRQFVYPATLEAVVAAHTPRRWWVWALPSLALAAAAVWAVVLPNSPDDTYSGVKGSTVGLAVYSVDLSGSPIKLEDGAHVRADASLRFQARPTTPCYLWVVSVDAQGQVSKLFPAQGEAQVVAGDTTLPGGATLDGVAGPERVFAVCTPAPVPFETVASQAKVTSETAVRATNRLELSVDGAQGTLLLEKTP